MKYTNLFFVLIVLAVLTMAANLKAEKTGKVVGWGNQVFGVDLSKGFVKVAAGLFHSLGLKGNGSIVAWGDNGSGQCNISFPNSGFVAFNFGD